MTIRGGTIRRFDCSENDGFVDQTGFTDTVADVFVIALSDKCLKVVGLFVAIMNTRSFINLALASTTKKKKGRKLFVTYVIVAYLLRKSRGILFLT